MRQVTEFSFEIQKQCTTQNGDIPITVVGQTCNGRAEAFAIGGLGPFPIPSPELFLITLAVIVLGWIAAYGAARRWGVEG